MLNMKYDNHNTSKGKWSGTIFQYPPNSEAIGSKEFNITQDCPKEVPKFKGSNVLFICPQ